MAAAERRCHSVSAVSRSASPSASFRSIRPLAKARRVNSPGCAILVSGIACKAVSTPRTTARPPWRCSSARSSPVAVFGPGKTSTSASSKTPPCAGSISLRSEALRGAGRVRTSAFTASKARCPLIRITAIAAGGAPLDSAKIVSSRCMDWRYFLSLPPPRAPAASPPIRLLTKSML